MLVAASLGLGKRLVTELTQCLYAGEPDLERLAYAVRPGERRGYDLRASNFSLSSWTSILLLYHYTIEMKLRVNENIIIDSIDELH